MYAGASLKPDGREEEGLSALALPRCMYAGASLKQAGSASLPRPERGPARSPRQASQPSCRWTHNEAPAYMLEALAGPTPRCRCRRGVVDPAGSTCRWRSTKAGTGDPATPGVYVRIEADQPLRSTKAGTEAPATRSGTTAPCRSSMSLNESRDRSPGNTGAVYDGRLRDGRRSTKVGAEAPATPLPVQGRLQRIHRRSTKAGTEAPATQPPVSSRTPPTPRAQQRPGPKPRQHKSLWFTASFEWPTAQQRPGPKPRQHPWPCGRPTSRATSLNKGRDRSPGNTTLRRMLDWGNRLAQQRPGPKPRQHLTEGYRFFERSSRSTKAGTEAPATQQRVHATRPRCDRSTKAGTEAPATPDHGGQPLSVVAGALNKGRDRSPGNTNGQAGHAGRYAVAQQRPGPKPRQHSAIPSEYTSWA